MCHEGGEVLCCDKCPRVFHIQCSGISTPPDDDDEWVCPVCKVNYIHSYYITNNYIYNPLTEYFS